MPMLGSRQALGAGTMCGLSPFSLIVFGNDHYWSCGEFFIVSFSFSELSTLPRQLFKHEGVL